MARIVIIGAHGRVAMSTAPRLVANGHQVTGVIRNPDHHDEVAGTGALAIHADVETLDGEAFEEVLADHDVVVWSAGAGGGDPARTEAVDHLAAVASMDAAVAVGAGRYVMVSYLGAGRDHGVPSDNSFFAYAQAKAAADEHLRASPLAWTILGPGALTLEAGTGAVEIAPSPAASSVARADVAAMIAAVIERPQTAHRTIPFNNGPVPIAEALEAFLQS